MNLILEQTGFLTKKNFRSFKLIYRKMGYSKYFHKMIDTRMMRKAMAGFH